MGDERILEPGDNCWRIERASRVAFLVDGQAYFRALRAAMREARQSILILSWDIDTRLRLSPGEDDGLPEALGDFLHALVRRRRGLRVHALNWDWAMLYALERQWLPVYRLELKRHRRLKLHFDDHHPFGASQHQKVVVVDDALAFSGGFDPTHSRWDTTEHLPDDPRRTDPDGSRYRPFHDVQTMVDGAAAVALGDLARERWRRATGDEIAPPQAAQRASWPEGVAVDARDLDVAVARTRAAFDGAPEVREVERLYLDSIAAARDHIYAENQYLTAARVGEALAARLREPDGPEVVLALPLRTGGWLEQNTMDVLRARLVADLEQADAHGRLRIYYPQREGLGDEHISLHAKVMVIDERLLRVASSNLSNRSMGLDSECDLAIEARDERTRAVVAGLRDRLLAEHLGTDAATVARAIRESGSLIAAIESLRGEPRSLEPLKTEVPELADELLPGRILVDPERPVDFDELAEQMLPADEQRSAARAGVKLLWLLAAALALAAAWRWTPLQHWLDVGTLIETAEHLKTAPYRPLIVIAAYLVGGALVVPITLLLVVTVLTFGPWEGTLYALLGAQLSAMLTYGAGRLMGRDFIRRFAGRRVKRLSRRLGGSGILAVFAVRLLPIAPFTLVNLIAGASHIRATDFAVGNLLGLLPGTLALALFTDRASAVVREPGLPAVLLLVVAVAAAAGALFALRRWLARPGRSGGSLEAAGRKRG